jgi:hypothetical protein
MQPERLTVKQTPTGYWTVQRGARQLAGAMTRDAAERERDMLDRLHEQGVKRAGTRRPPVKA